MTMDLDGSVPLGHNSNTVATILCCNCGAPIDGTTAAGALCYDCIKLTVDISAGIPREATLHFCKDCDRWLLPPSTWVVAQPESREMLALCLKKLRGLTKVRIVDASFIWTEPHSRRIKMKMTVQDEVQSGVLLQQSFEVTFVVNTQQCPECAKSYTANVWRACVQLRQKVHHKRTFLFLEQLIMKHNAHRDTLNIKEAKHGIDFFFSNKNQAEKFLDFLNSVVPIKSTKSQELISQDVHTSTKSYKFTFSVEIVPVCKDDIVALPIKMAKSIGNVSPILLCHRIGTSVYLMDPETLDTADIPANVYWRAPFHPLMDAPTLTEFIVMDVELLGQKKGRWSLGEVTVARAADLGSNDKTYFCRTHLGGLLRAGDSVMGYMLTGTNFNNTEFDAIEASAQYGQRIPDVVLVKKVYQRRHRHKRQWELKRMAKDEGEMLPKKADQERMDREYEQFLRDIEEDPEARAAIALYKKKAQPVEDDAMSMADTEADEDDLPAIDMNELLEDFEEMTMDDA